MNLSRFLNYARYAGRPGIWPELARRTQRYASRHTSLHRSTAVPARPSNVGQEATAWCKARAVGNQAAIAQIFGNQAPVLSPQQLFESEFAAARRRVDACPHRLGGAGNLDLLYTLCQHLEAAKVVETGVAYGWSSLTILLSLRQRPDAHLYSVDLPYMELNSDRWVGVAVPHQLHTHWTLYRQADREGLPRALNAAQSLDFAHYDSDKSSAGRCWAFPRMWDALRPGGIVVSDDISDNFGFRDYCESLGVAPIIIEDDGKYQGLLVKPMVV